MPTVSRTKQGNAEVCEIVEQSGVAEKRFGGGNEEMEVSETRAPKNPEQSRAAKSPRGTLHELTSDQAAALPFPVGASVWHRSGCGEFMASGVVQSISVDLLSRTIYYNIAPSTESHSRSELVREEEVICFAAGCPVGVKMEDDQEVDGSVLYGQSSGDRVLYAVMLHVEGNDRFKVEEGVEPARIRYRATKVAGGQPVSFTDTTTSIDEPPAIPSVLELKNTVSDKASSEDTAATKQTGSDSGNRSSADKKRSRGSLQRLEGVAHDRSLASKRSKDIVRVDIPSWLLQSRASQRDLLAHLQSDTTLSNYSVKGRGTSMHVSAAAAAKQALKDSVQESLLRFLGDDRSDGRLLYDLALSAGLDTVLPLDGPSGRKVVKSSSLVKHTVVWFTIISLPSIEADGREREWHGRYLSHDCVLDTIRHKTKCSICVYGEDFAGPLKKCSPYILLYGARLRNVNIAHNKVMALIEGHQQTCTCT